MKICSEASLSLLRKINSSISERNFHEHTHVLYDIRTLLGNEEKVYLEIGCYVGSSACLMMSHPYKTKVYSIDPCNLIHHHYWGRYDQSTTILKNIEKNKNNPDSEFKLIQGFSCEEITLNKLKKLKIDILFIDGDHRMKAVLDDFENYIDLVSEGGYIVFDDYLDDDHSPSKTCS